MHDWLKSSNIFLYSYFGVGRVKDVKEEFKMLLRSEQVEMSLSLIGSFSVWDTFKGPNSLFNTQKWKIKTSHVSAT